MPNSKDSLKVPLTNGLSEGMEAMWVMDANGQTNFVPLQTLDLDDKNSFLRLVKLKVANAFQPSEEVVMLKSEAKKIASKVYSGEGTIKMTSYQPNDLKYVAETNDNQLAVFSEIYYPDGWKVYVNGKEKPIVKVNYLLRGVEIPKGKSTIEMKFDLPKFHLGNTIALIGSIIMLALLGFVIYLRTKKNKNNSSIEK